MKTKKTRIQAGSIHISLPDVDMPAFDQIARAMGSDRTKLIGFLINTFARAYQKSSTPRSSPGAGGPGRLVWPPRFMTTREETRLHDTSDPSNSSNTGSKNDCHSK